VAQRNVVRLLMLVNDLLDMQKIEAGRLELRPEPLDLGEALRQAVMANQGYASEFSVQFDLDPPPPGAWVSADPLRFEQAVANLLSNAAKFSPVHGTVRVEAHSRGDYWRVSVHNRGEPIPEAFRGRIFQKFSQADTGTTRAVKGTGLGLAITKAIVEGLGGRLGYESGGEGTTFWMDLKKAGAPG
jgi:signal transduction histidine kinase